ncbi:MAG: hypothetical protein WC389_12810 [Lutibacter sp.]|jgi:hypothetical protein
MGLHAPFGYVGYESTMAQTIIDLLDKFCSGCHTNDDYHKGCRGCPCGNLICECREYILGAMLEDEHHKQYTTEEWQQRRVKYLGHRDSQEEIERELKFVADYKPECDVLRKMQVILKDIEPHPFFYGDERPQTLIDFENLVHEYAVLRKQRLNKWGLKTE